MNYIVFSSEDDLDKLRIMKETAFPQEIYKCVHIEIYKISICYFNNISIK